ncbi:uncharacterized protein F4822DRAFT_62473 [Hypoxylon trugodes]|uniref:uncharacterized protein n=1 Tax=Hypoxylon trugodes TaxID=326681 RepID=UPI00218DBB0E|nr:uncharacterized protein F4822DRAFT_62473 [Hypoxylon trugodes]KAI1384143.1 hypothetical protein F4822DRAFT_62473 [Hypoxylon trugodes]
MLALRVAAALRAATADLTDPPAGLTNGLVLSDDVVARLNGQLRVCVARWCSRLLSWLWLAGYVRVPGDVSYQSNSSLVGLVLDHVMALESVVNNDGEARPIPRPVSSRENRRFREELEGEIRVTPEPSIVSFVDAE